MHFPYIAFFIMSIATLHDDAKMATISDIVRVGRLFIYKILRAVNVTAYGLYFRGERAKFRIKIYISADMRRGKNIASSKRQKIINRQHSSSTFPHSLCVEYFTSYFANSRSSFVTKFSQFLENIVNYM